MQTTIRSSFGLFLVVSMTLWSTMPAGSALPPTPEEEQGPDVAYAVGPAVMLWEVDGQIAPDAGTIAFLDCEGLCDLVIFSGAIVSQFVCDRGSGTHVSAPGIVLNCPQDVDCAGSVTGMTNPTAACTFSLTSEMGRSIVSAGACVPQ